MKRDDDYQAMKDGLALRERRSKKAPPPRPAIRLSLSCSCGGTLAGVVSAPIRDAFKLRDIYLSFHRADGCAVTDKSEDIS